MAKLENKALYAGLSGLDFEGTTYDLSGGAVLEKTYVHFMAPYTLAFKRPERPGAHHPGPWMSAASGVAYDITTQLTISSELGSDLPSRMEVARVVLFVLRLWSNPSIVLHVFSSHPFSEISEAGEGVASLIPAEVYPRSFALGLIDGTKVHESLEWVRDNWQSAYKLYCSSTEFRLAADALTNGQFVPNDALTMISLWGAIEAIFSPSTTELKFRVSSLVASYLHPPGTDRASKQKEIAKLYDKRSAAAHGKPKHDPEDLLATFELLRKVLIKAIRDEEMPKRDKLDGLLFGSEAWS